MNLAFGDGGGSGATRLASTFLSNRSPIGVNVSTLSSVTVGTNSPGSVDMYNYTSSTKHFFFSFFFNYKKQ